MASLDTECLRCHGQGRGTSTSTAPPTLPLASASSDDSPSGGSPTVDPSTGHPPPRFLPSHAVPQPGGANARAYSALRNDPVMAELSRNPRRISLGVDHGLNFTAIFVLFAVVFVALPWGCAKLFMHPQPNAASVQLGTTQNTAPDGSMTADASDAEEAPKSSHSSLAVPTK